MRLLGVLAALVALPVIAIIGAGFFLDAAEPVLVPSDAIVVISGDDQNARFREGVRLYQQGLGRYLLFSGAAQDGGLSNAGAMRTMALDAGVPSSDILVEPEGSDTWGNAVHTRTILEGKNVRSLILVTSPYHVRRAKLTFETAFEGAEMRVLAHSAPDSEWRKLSWWSEDETRRLTVTELEKLAYIAVTGRYHQ